MTTANILIPNTGALNALAAWLAAADGPLAASLYVSNTIYNPARVLSDYTLASFPGYAPVNPITWGAPFLNTDGKAESDSAACVWTFTGSTGTYIVFGVLLTDPALTELRAVIPFLSPEAITPTVPSLSRVLQLTDVSEL